MRLMMRFGRAAIVLMFLGVLHMNDACGDVQEIRTDVCVVGGGSGGIGAALAAARSGVDVVLIEKQDRLGGTSVNAYVSNWEPGPGDSFAREIYDRLAKMPDAVCIVGDHNYDRRKGSFGLWLPMANGTYEQTLRRSARRRKLWRAAVFEPDRFVEVVSDLLKEPGRCRVLLRTCFTEAKTDGKRVAAITAKGDDGTEYLIRAKVFLDCTGGAYLCRAIGCETMVGTESKSRYQEPSAPDEAQGTLNAISLCYRVRKRATPVRQAEPDPPVRGWPRSAHVSGLPNGDRIVNPLALLPGRALIDMGYDGAMAKCKKLARAQWQWLQGNPTFAGYEFDSFAPMLGIRESYRVVGEYVLTEHDVRGGLSRQTHADIIAIADHALDLHGVRNSRISGELREPYGIPYRCLIPRGWENVLIACRGASFSHVAASSCRLSRTILSLGHAAGIGAAMAAKGNVSVGEVDMAQLKAQLDLSVPEP